MVAALALMDIFENRLALLWLDATLVDASDAAPDQLSVDYGVSCRSALYLPSQDFISWRGWAGPMRVLLFLQPSVLRLGRGRLGWEAAD